MTVCLKIRDLTASQVLRNIEGLWTYASHFLKKSTVAPEVDELLIEEPGELEVQRGVMRHLAGQHDALTHRHVQMPSRTGDRSWFCERGESHQQCVSSFRIDISSPDCLMFAEH